MSGAMYIHNCNILNNSQIMLNCANVTIEGCTILNNIGKYMFSSSNGCIKLFNCTCDNDSAVGDVDISKIDPNPKPFINAILPSFLTDLCDVGYDFVGTLTPNVPGWENVGLASNTRCFVTCANYIPILWDDVYQFISYIFMITFLPSN